MRPVAEERFVPSRASSATREVVRSRQHIDAARRSLELAVEMYGGSPGSAPVSALEHALGQLEEAEAALWEASQ